MTQGKIADVSLTRHKLIPVPIRGVPICVWGLRQKKSHMGRHITHNEIVRISGLTYMLIPKWEQTPYGYGESPNAKFFVSLPLSIRGSPYGNGETKWLIILIW